MLSSRVSLERYVLIVDDDVALGTVLCRTVESFGLEARHAESSLHALRAVDGNQHCVILCDYLLGSGLDGLAFLELARKRWPATPRILMTGDPSGDVVMRASTRAAAKVLIKPITMADLRRTLREAVAL